MAPGTRALFRLIARHSARRSRRIGRQSLGVGSALAALCVGCVSTQTPSTHSLPTDAHWSWRARGRIVLVAAIDDPDRPRNAARMDVAGTSQVVPLWEADSEISDWLPSPDGSQVVYREVWHYVPKTEALVVRALVPDASARYVVMGEPELGRLAGQVWSPSGDALAYGKQVGHVESFSGAGGTRRWEMRVVTVGASVASASADQQAGVPTAATGGDGDAPPEVNAALDDRRLFALDGADLGNNVFSLVGWSPEQSRAVVLETRGGGGGSPALRVYDTVDGRLVTRLAPGGDDVRVVAAPDGRRVAWLSTAAGVGTVDVATGRWQAIEAILAGDTPFGLAWSADGRWLGWAVAATVTVSGREPTGGLTTVRPVSVFAKRLTGWPRGSGVRNAWFNLDAADGALGLLALSPGGEVALLTDVTVDGRTVARTAVLTRDETMDDTGPFMAEHPLPAGAWGVGWWP